MLRRQPSASNAGPGTVPGGLTRTGPGLRPVLVLSAALALCFILLQVSAPTSAASAPEEGLKVQATLVAPATAVTRGMPFEVGLRQVIAPHWHTYWKNPGDSGEPTRLTWTLPSGFTASEIHWPIPEALPVGPLLNYGYSNEVLLPVTITPPKDFAGDTVSLAAKAEWLVCEKICIPEETAVSLTLPVVSQTRPNASPAAGLFALTARAQPIDAGWTASVSRSAGRVILDVAAAGLDRTRIIEARFFPEVWGAIEPAAPQKLNWNARGFSLDMQAAEAGPKAAGGPLDGVLVLTERLSGDEQVRNGITIKAADVGSAATGGAAPSGDAAPPLAGGGIGLLQAVLFAVLGGAILNLMPCVLPILSVKVMALAGHANEDDAAARLRGGLAYLAGVAASFAALAAVILTVRGAGEVLGWGFQFQSPLFVLGLAALFLVMGLSLSGVFEVGGGLVGLGQGLTRRDGLAGSFFIGVLATIAATPCTAPFMGAAIGYAMARPALELVVVLQALGLGFAAPVLALSASRSAARLLPRPGPWMETLKQALAFPLYATVVWLVWVLSLQSGSDGVLAAGIVLVTVAFAAWLIGQRGLPLGIRAVVATLAVVAAVLLALPQVNTPVAERPQDGSTPQTAAVPPADGAEPFSLARVAEARSGGRPVFVNLTAAWCISCKVNERIALQTEGFRKALRDHDIVYLKGDWTSRDDRISEVLRSYGRAGVPLYLLYPADPNAEAIILPQLLTETIVTGYFAMLNAGRGQPEK